MIASICKKISYIFIHRVDPPPPLLALWRTTVKMKAMASLRASLDEKSSAAWSTIGWGLSNKGRRTIGSNDNKQCQWEASNDATLHQGSQHSLEAEEKVGDCVIANLKTFLGGLFKASLWWGSIVWSFPILCIICSIAFLDKNVSQFIWIGIPNINFSRNMWSCAKYI